MDKLFFTRLHNFIYLQAYRYVGFSTYSQSDK